MNNDEQRDVAVLREAKIPLTKATDGALEFPEAADALDFVGVPVKEAAPVNVDRSRLQEAASAEMRHHDVVASPDLTDAEILAESVPVQD